MVLNARCFGDRIFYWFIRGNDMVDTIGKFLTVLPYSICVIIFIIVLWNEWKE